MCKLSGFIKPRRYLCGLSRGFSLLEVLVVLTIVGLVSAITMTMVSQLRQNLERFFPAAEYYSRLEVRIGMLSRLINGMVPAHVPATSFKGDQNGFMGLGTYFPSDPWSSEQRVKVSIVKSQLTSLVMAERLAPAVRGEAKVQGRVQALIDRLTAWS